MQLFFRTTNSLLLLLLIYGLTYVPISQGAQPVADPNQRRLGEALSEMAANFEFALSLASNHWVEVPVAEITNDGAMQERLEMLLGGMNYILEHKGRKQIIVHILSDVPPELIAGFGQDQLVNEFLETQIVHRDIGDFLVSTTSSGIQEFVKIEPPLEDGEQKNGEWVFMDGPDGLEEGIWVNNEQSADTELGDTLEHRYTSDGIEEWISVNKVKETKRPVIRMFTSTGIEELISVTKPTKNVQHNERGWTTTFDNDGIEERLLSRQSGNGQPVEPR